MAYDRSDWSAMYSMFETALALRVGARDGAGFRRSRGDRAGRQLAYRQPSAGATWVRMLSMTWVL